MVLGTIYSCFFFLAIALRWYPSTKTITAENKMHYNIRPKGCSYVSKTRDKNTPVLVWCISIRLGQLEILYYTFFLSMRMYLENLSDIFLNSKNMVSQHYKRCYKKKINRRELYIFFFEGWRTLFFEFKSVKTQQQQIYSKKWMKIWNIIINVTY